jgi:hypothetical protein
MRRLRVARWPCPQHAFLTRRHPELHRELTQPALLHPRPGIIGQEGEATPAGYEAWGSAPADPRYALEFSPETQTLQTKLRRTR